MQYVPNNDAKYPNVKRPKAMKLNSLFELNCYLIGLTSVAATFYCYGVQDAFIRNNSRLHRLCAYACWELNKRIHLKKMITFVGIWTALIGLAIAES